MNKFLERLNSGEVLVADGATGTNLQKVGLIGGMHTEDWVLDHPDKILDLEKAFVEAGSDILLTCTFGGTFPRMKGAKHAEDVDRINKRAVELAREAASLRDGVLVAGSIGPIGQLIKPYGPLAYEEAVTAFQQQAKSLADGGADLIVLETHFSIEEVNAAFEGARSMTDLPIVVSFGYDRATRTMMGTKPTDVMKKYKPMGAAVIGANCGTTLENMEAIIKEYSAAGDGFPLWAKPNAGMPRLVDEEAVYDVTPEEMADYAKRFVALGARVVGGCCGSTPEHVAAIAKAVKK
jgi:5-methyltetrahydrofolate--homocysteine methyltransferase